MCGSLHRGSAAEVVWAKTRDGVAVGVWDRLNEWLSAAIVVSLTWVSGIVSSGAPPGPAPAGGSSPTSFMIGWAQQVEQPPIEQVGEGTGDDVETLDESGSPVEETAEDDPETLDAGAPPAAQDDVELLDQGAQPATAGQPVETVYVAPAADTTTTFVAPESALPAATGPALPPGFGTGRVQAVAGRGETPIGIADCHVGAVTGRAYVGIDCGEDEGTSFVGHAPSFEAFPFVLEAEFPFEGDEAFFTDPNFPFGSDGELAVAASRDDGSETDVFVSARGGNRERDDEASTAPVIETGGDSTVALAQRARDREPRVRVENRSRPDEKEKKGARSESDGGETSSESWKENRGGGRDDRANAEGNGKKSDGKKSKDTKSKSKKDRADRKEKKRDRDR